MASVYSFIRAEVKRGIPSAARSRGLHCIRDCSSKGLISETENAARRTLYHPMTFEVLKEGLAVIVAHTLDQLNSVLKICQGLLTTPVYRGPSRRIVTIAIY
jgi:hypothetical protein